MNDTRKLRNFCVEFEVRVHTVNQGSCMASTTLRFSFQPFLHNSTVFCVNSVFLNSLSPTPLFHWFSGLSLLYEFCFPHFITWSLSGALISGSLSLFFMLPSPSLPFCHWQLLADSFALFLSQSNKDCLERAAALSFEQKILQTLCRLAIDLLD